MKNKSFAWMTIFAFLLYSWSCIAHSIKKEIPEKAALRRGGIVRVYTISGETIEFPKGRPAYIYGDVIQGAPPSGVLRLQKQDVDRQVKDVQGTMSMIMKSGEVYEIAQVISEDENSYTVALDPRKILKIPLSQVELVEVRRVDAGLTFLATVGAIAATTGIIVAIIALTKESCPFIYAWDGTGYVFDAEPYGGAICPAKKRTELCALERLRPENGVYKLKLTNEVDETQYTDELKLLVVDHIPGVQVVPDENGRIHTFANSVLPSRAYEASGRSILPYVAKADWIYWQSRDEGRDTLKSETLRDELIFEFPKPAGVTQAKLLFNGGNTLWGSQMLKRYLELYGSAIQERYALMENPVAASMMRQWDLREELFLLQARVETMSGWRTKAVLLGGGPFITEDKAYSLDLSDVPGDTLRLRLTPPAPFWMINFLAVDYGEDLPVEMQELSAVRAVDFSGHDVREILAATDNLYQVMPNAGNWAELEFPAPPERPGMTRTVFAKASGYYDIHLNRQGPPRQEILDKLRDEPGYAVQFGYTEFLKWKNEIARQRHAQPPYR
jgi:hypothetical protein